MNKKILGISAGVAIIAVIAIIAVLMITPNTQPITSQKHNEKIGLIINTPNPSISLPELHKIYADASSTGIGRSNVYLFWNLIEPAKGEFDWKQSDVLMSYNKNNDLKVTLYFSV
ncbi:MAG TPA: hypothetical protein VLD64_04820, partial [Nitrosarchaeum sp.]|nr:hypothetical protein [Nitrosarchaeum sp.]